MLHTAVVPVELVRKLNAVQAKTLDRVLNRISQIRDFVFDVFIASSATDYIPWKLILGFFNFTKLPHVITETINL